MVKPIFDVFDPTTHPTEFAGEVNESLDYIEFGITTVEGYVATKLYFDELLNDGNYLNDLQSYEDGILDYYNTEYGASETVLTDGILNNLSAKEMEVLTISLTNGVVFQEHKDQVLIYYNDFRGDDTNATVYNNIKTYLTPLQQGIARLLASHVGSIFIEGTDAYTDLVAWADAFKASVIAAISNDIDLAVKITEATALYNNLTATVTTGTTLNTDLAANITLAGTTNTDLAAVIATAANNVTLLNAANTTAQATLDNLDAAIEAGGLNNYLLLSNIVNDLISIDTNKAASANTVKSLKDLFDALGISDVSGLQTALDSKAASLGDLGITVAASLINYLSGATSNIQTQLNGKSATTHNHSGTYEPSFTKNTAFNKNLGTTAGTVSEGNHAHSNYADLTGATFSGLVAYDDTAFTTNIDCSLGNSFNKTVTANFTQTFSNVPVSGNACVIVLKLTNGGAYTITWSAAIKWAGGTAPTLTASGTDSVVLYTIDGGTNWYGNANIGYA